jgi:hypothetical protein
MTRKRSDEQLPLPLPTVRRTIGRVEQATSRAIRAAQTAGEVGPLHAGAAALARSLARGVDEAEAKRDPWARAACSRELRETLASLGLDRASRGELPRGADNAGLDIAAYLAAYDAAAAGDSPEP